MEAAKDQTGSRFIQDKIVDADAATVGVIFDEIQPTAIDLMKDVFANYIVQLLIQEGTPDQQRQVLNMMEGRVVELSLNKFSCRVIQTLIEVLDSSDLSPIVQELAS